MCQDQLSKKNLNAKTPHTPERVHGGLGWLRVVPIMALPAHFGLSFDPLPKARRSLKMRLSMDSISDS